MSRTFIYRLIHYYIFDQQMSIANLCNIYVSVSIAQVSVLICFLGGLPGFEKKKKTDLE